MATATMNHTHTLPAVEAAPQAAGIRSDVPPGVMRAAIVAMVGAGLMLFAAGAFMWYGALFGYRDFL
jgi:hypothetical protein